MFLFFVSFFVLFYYYLELKWTSRYLTCAAVSSGPWISHGGGTFLNRSNLMSRKTDAARASGKVRPRAATVDGKCEHFMLQCMAPGLSGYNDHAQTPPKAESLRVPVLWHHIPQARVSFTRANARVSD